MCFCLGLFLSSDPTTFQALASFEPSISRCPFKLSTQVPKLVVAWQGQFYYHQLTIKTDQSKFKLQFHVCSKMKCMTLVNSKQIHGIFSTTYIPLHANLKYRPFHWSSLPCTVSSYFVNKLPCFKHPWSSIIV